MGEERLDLFHFRPYVYCKVAPRVDGAAWPKPRSGHRIVCDDTDLYLYGGFCPQLSSADAREMDGDPVWVESRPLYRELWRYNMGAREWRRLPCSQSMPRELASSAACMRAGVVFVFGGSGYPFGSASSNRVYTYDARRAGAAPEEDGMRELATSGERPRAMYGQAVLLVWPHLYAVGGTTGFEFSSDVHRLDLRTARWEQMYVYTGGALRSRLAGTATSWPGTASACTCWVVAPATPPAPSRYLPPA
ncbi:hypothetical protein PR048_026923 [Dryococelus australis]|uniref:Uncharacterized protein n=1 Tax=Dryococelus australis TaxID=614101 RepID=A0ABQ9GMP2_9NEOP|nr:hypothetical protein PR048_026923 [Dryococelus australis]